MSYCICSVKIDVIIFQNLVDNAARFEYNITQMSPIKGSSLRASLCMRVADIVIPSRFCASGVGINVCLERDF